MYSLFNTNLPYACYFPCCYPGIGFYCMVICNFWDEGKLCLGKEAIVEKIETNPVNDIMKV